MAWISIAQRASLQPSIIAAVFALASTTVLAGQFEDALSLYQQGRIAHAIELWEGASQQGDLRAQFSLGVLYYEGRVVPRDLERSVSWLTRAAQGGYAPAALNLGNAYKNGDGVEVDHRAAVQWWYRAAQQGYSRAQYNLATALLHGRGIAPDREEALRLFRLAAENGSPQARQMLAQLSEPAPAVGAALNERHADWLLAQPGDQLTIQLFSGPNLARLTQFIAENALHQRVAWFSFERDGDPWYGLVYGNFESTGDAQAVLDALRPSLLARKPWIRPFKQIHSLIESRQKLPPLGDST